MRKLVVCTAAPLLLLAGLSACRLAQSAPTPTATRNMTAVPKVIPVSTLPPGVDRSDIRELDLETIKAIQQIQREQPGLSFGIRGTYAEQVPDTYDAFRVEENTPFVGRFNLWNAYPQTHEFAITCMVDHVQMSCTPDAPLVQMLTLETGQEIHLPLEIHGLARGLHDFSVTFWQDPYADPDEPQADSRIFNAFPTSRARVSLFVGGDTRPPVSITYETPTGQTHHGVNRVRISQERDPRNEYGFPDMTYLAVPAGEMFDLYVHLNNKDDVGIDMAVTAFVNCEQIPLYRNGKAYTPLYIHNQSKTWQPVAIQIRAPDEPGRYEFIVVGTLFPFARMDVETEEYYGIESLINNAYSSVRVILEAK